jgi:hypothetical protein
VYGKHEIFKEAPPIALARRGFFAVSLNHIESDLVRLNIAESDFTKWQSNAAAIHNERPQGHRGGELLCSEISAGGVHRF